MCIISWQWSILNSLNSLNKPNVLKPHRNYLLVVCACVMSFSQPVPQSRPDNTSGTVPGCNDWKRSFSEVGGDHLIQLCLVLICLATRVLTCVILLVSTAVWSMSGLLFCYSRFVLLIMKRKEFRQNFSEIEDLINIQTTEEQSVVCLKPCQDHQEQDQSQYKPNIWTL